MKRTAYYLAACMAVVLAAAVLMSGCGGGSTASNTDKGAKPTYTVTYYGNGSTGGAVPTDNGKYEQGQTITVLDNTGNLVNAGSSFTGWNTKGDGTGQTYSASQTVTVGSSNVYLYAMWTLKPTHTVTYNANDTSGSVTGTVPVDYTNYVEGQQITVVGNTGLLSKYGYAFAGWNTLANGLGTTYTASQSFPMGSANVILYAKWTANPTYTVTYNGNSSTSGTLPDDSTHYEQGQTITVLGNAGNLVRPGYAFTGWNTQADGSGTTYAAATTFAMGSVNVTLYAKWAPTYGVTYNGNGSTGGNVPVDALSYLPSATVTVLANTGTLAKTNYTFAGWNTAANGSGTSYAASGSVTFSMGSANVTLYAQWTANPTYTVTYDGNGSTGGTAPTDSAHYQQGATVTVKANSIIVSQTLVNSSASFAGWNTAANGAGTDYAAAATFTMGSANVTLYAKWTPYVLPTLTTAVTSSIKGTMATSGGTISATGGAPVTARGLTWSLSSSPSGTGFISSNGTGVGTFSNVMTGLTLSTTYYVTAYATNSVGTAYGNVVSFTTNSTYSYGDTGPAGGMIFYDQGSVINGWEFLEAASSDQTIGYWGPNTPGQPLLNTLSSVGTGTANTATIVASLGVGTFYAAGKCDALISGGASDWFLPSIDELTQMYLNLPDKSSFGGSSYWSSTENNLDSREAWIRPMTGNTLSTMDKGYAYIGLRCVRQF